MSSSDEFNSSNISSNHGTLQRSTGKEAEKKAFAQRYSFALNRLGKNDAFVARRAGVPKNTLSRWSNGLSVPEAKHVFALADALEINPRWLVTGQGPRFPSESVAEDGSGEWRLIGLYRSLGKAQQAHLVETAKLLWNSAVQDRLREVAPTVHDRPAGFGGFEGEEE